MPLALAPFNIWPLALIGIATAIWLNHTAENSKEASLLGWLYGVSFFGLGVSWIYGSMQTVETPVWLSVFLTAGFCLALALFFLFQFWFYHKFLKSLPGALMLLAPCWWVVNEWLREWVFTGIPWLFAGYATINLPIAQLAAVVGVYGLSLIMALIAAWLLIAALHWKAEKKAAMTAAFGSVVLFIIALAAGLTFPAAHWTSSQQSIRVAAVQSNINQKTKWIEAQQTPTLRFFGKALTVHGEADLMLWPEAAMTRLEDEIPTYLSDINAFAAKHDMALLTGIITHENFTTYYNAIKGYGTASGEYRKQHLVPFGEYVPLEGVLRGLIAFFDLPMSTMRPAGERQSPIQATVNDQPYFVAPVICYEAAYPNLVRRLAKEANLIAVVSNDAWFGDSIGPHQHLQITRMRAIENGRPMVRATQNGISALVDGNGEIVVRSEQFVEAILEGELTLRSGLTPFQTYNSALLPAGLILIILAMMALGNRVSSRAVQKAE
ncbi:apolipoprotein N-acyltransferase [Reinekea marinisedimentorum]|nr:apolipoprotein N-acyltransferase [Reinekea marinisedimentorum]